MGYFFAKEPPLKSLISPGFTMTSAGRNALWSAVFIPGETDGVSLGVGRKQAEGRQSNLPGLVAV